jgi:CSLREA domain-containing protein
MKINVLPLLRLIVWMALLLEWLAAPAPVYALTYTVNTTSDADDGACNATHCSLREAINAANANPGPDTINFNIPGAGARVISASPMPALTDAGTTVNGTSQPGYAGAPIVEVTGAGAESAPGFRVYAADTTIRGLSITEWSPGGIIVEGAAVTNVVIEDNYIGLRTDGTTPLANASIGGVGVFGGATGTQIRDNVISANVGQGIYLAETCPGFCIAPPASPSGTIIENNKIGTNAGGTAALGNDGNGIKVQAATDTTILNNLVSANAVVGVMVQDATNVTLRGNKIGTDVSGTIALGTTPVVAGTGISVFGSSTGVLIGGTGPGDGNLVSGNYGRGIDLGAPDVEVVANFIGTNAAGTASLPNGAGGGLVYGIWAAGGSNNSLIENNVICQGILVAGYGSGPVLGTVIQANRIGTNMDGTASICDGSIILADGTEGAQVLENVISSSSAVGVQIEFNSAYNVLRGNFIGTDATGTTVVGNQINGVAVSGALAIGNIVGGPGPGDGNLISGNGNGISVSGDASGTVIQGNKIGTDLSGSVALGNTIGISVGPSSGTVIGGSAPGEGNLISGNEGTGISLLSGGTLVVGNTLGLAADGSALGNGAYGIDVAGDGNTIGGPGLTDGNIVSSNALGGVHLSSANGNTVTGNLIGLDALGNPRGNGDPAVSIGAGIGLFGDGNVASLNTIAYSGYAGVAIQGSDNTVSGNKIHDNHAAGVSVLLGTANTISQNSIHDNGALGIDLVALPAAPGGVTLNDPGDGDSGPNGLLNFPEFTAGTTAAAGTACPGCTVEVFVAAMDPSGYGEGKTFITAVTADATGHFLAPLGSTFICARITATATDEAGNTSEFSKAVLRRGCIILPPLPPWVRGGPLIQNISASPNAIFASVPKGCEPTASQISAVISDPSGVESAMVVFTGGSEGKVPMSRASGNRWHAQLGPFETPGEIDWQIRATDSLGNRSETSVFMLTVNACIP